MTIRHRSILIALLACFFAAGSQAYVEPLHRKISGFAFDQAVSETDFLKRYRIGDVALSMRTSLQYGAEHEDDFPNSLNHFFDYQNRDGLTVRLFVPPLYIPACLEVGVRADEWALNPAARNPITLTRNSYTIDAAHNHWNEALTGATAADRAFAAQATFESLGHVIHLLQDMAQPEHTRNDQHLAMFGYGLSFGDVSASIYENWTRDNLVAPNFLEDGSPTIGFFIGYPTVTNRSYVRYFGDQSDWDGLAAYASRYHVTQDTNYGDRLFRCKTESQPTLSSTLREERPAITTVINALTGLPQDVPFVETIYSLPNMWDYNARRNDMDGFHSIESALDHETTKYDPLQRVFSLDETSWRTRAGNLIPKAVGYSAGVIERFFRGRANSFWYLQDDGTYHLQVRTSEPMTSVLVDVLEVGPQGEMIPLGWSMASRIDFYTDIDLFSNDIVEDANDPLYTHDLRVVLHGQLGDEENVTIADLLPRRHKMKLVLEYDTSVGYTQLGMQAIKQGQTWEDCAGCSTMSFWPNQGVFFNRNIPFSDINKGPFYGSIELTVGMTDSEEILADLLATPNSYTTQKTATVKLYKNDQQVAQLVIPYVLSLRHWIRFSGNGTLTVVEAGSR